MFKNIPLAESFIDVVTKHRFRHAIVRDDAILHRAVSNDVSGSPTNHHFRLRADSENLVVRLRNSHDGRFVQYYPLARDEDQDIGSAEIYAKFFRHIYQHDTITE